MKYVTCKWKEAAGIVGNQSHSRVEREVDAEVFQNNNGNETEDAQSSVGFMGQTADKM